MHHHAFVLILSLAIAGCALAAPAGSTTDATKASLIPVISSTAPTHASIKPVISSTAPTHASIKTASTHPTPATMITSSTLTPIIIKTTPRAGGSDGSSFDVGSFFGGMALIAGVAILVFVGYKCYAIRSGRGYNAM